MIRAGSPEFPGYHDEEQYDGLPLEDDQKVHWPVLIKPVRVGGGKGPRVVRREALEGYNDPSVLERFIERPRHVEVQVSGDS